MYANKGFTLIELILVTVIIGILAGMVALNFAGRTEEARVKAAKGDIHTLQTAIDLYALDHNDKFPKQLSELMTPPSGRKPYLKQLKKDPWSNDYVYVFPGKHFQDSYDVFSKGPDGQEGTEDDVVPWETEE